MNNKGSFIEGFTGIIMFIVLVFIFVLMCGVYMFMASEIRTNLVNSDIANETAGGKQIGEIFEASMSDIVNATVSLRWISYFLIFGMIMAVFIGCFMVRSNPVFFVPYIFLCIVAVILAVQISNGYQMLLDRSNDLQPHLESMHGANFLLSNFAIVVCVISIIGGIIMYASYATGSEYYV